MKEIDLKELIEKVDAFAVEQKTVVRKTFDDYLKNKRDNGQYINNIITFDDGEDCEYFHKLLANIGIDITDIT